MGDKYVIAESVLPNQVSAVRVQLFESYIEPQIAQAVDVEQCGYVRSPTREELHTFVYNDINEHNALQAIHANEHNALQAIHAILSMEQNQTINLSELRNTLSEDFPAVPSSIIIQEINNTSLPIIIDEQNNTDNLIIIAERHNNRIQLNLCILIGLLSVSIFLLIFGLKIYSYTK